MCEEYPQLWAYDFKVSWGEDLFAIMSIGNFASDANGICELYIEYQDDTGNHPPAEVSRVNFGVMFFQAFVLQQSGGQNAQIWVNPNSIPFAAAISDIVDPVPGPNPFVVTPAALTASPATESSYLPAFEVSLGEMIGAPSAYFYIDWVNEVTVAWATTCV